MITTDIIIVSYKDKEPLEKCIASIEEHCTDYNLIIEDNNIEGQNRGFTRAVNDGVKKGNAPFVFLINSDAILLPEAQQALITRFSYGEKVGLVGSMQIDPDDPTMDSIRYGGSLRLFPSGVHKPGRISMGHCLIPEKQTWLNFASVMLCRRVFDKIGLLDQNMFLIFSDSDFCLMCRDAGFECWYEPRSRVLHKLKASKSISEWHQKDMLAFMKKWGIKALPDGKFEYSRKFQKLDIFP
jgi:GT2 family glycosyltransferase